MQGVDRPLGEHVTCVWVLWCAAVLVAMLLAPGLRPDAGTARTVVWLTFLLLFTVCLPVALDHVTGFRQAIVSLVQAVVDLLVAIVLGVGGLTAVWLFIRFHSPPASCGSM